MSKRSFTARFEWLPDMDSNHDKEIQNLRCCHYTIGQEGWEIGAVCARVKSRDAHFFTACHLPASAMTSGACSFTLFFSG